MAKLKPSAFVSLDMTKDEFQTEPEFIYGGPFLEERKVDGFIDSAQPMNYQCSGTFKQGHAYKCLKDKLPVIITKVIDDLSKKGNATEVIAILSKLKNDLVTNKKYAPFTLDSVEVDRWNDWLDDCKHPFYFKNDWIFTESYVYMRIREALDLHKMYDYDPWEKIKKESMESALLPMCIIAGSLDEMIADEENRRMQFSTLLKICAWANKFDMTTTDGSVFLVTKDEEVYNPFQIVETNKDKFVVDDSKKVKFPTKELNPIDPNNPGDTEPWPPPKVKKGKKKDEPPPPPPEPEEPDPNKPPEPDKIPCPAKIKAPSMYTFDIVCDNAGYDLFTDICVADFAISVGWVQRARFHLKNIPWYVSQATDKDFWALINFIKDAKFYREIPVEVKPPPKGTPPPEEPEPPPPPIIADSENLKRLAQRWAEYLENKTFIIMTEDYWTSPLTFPKMKKTDYQLYRKLQFSCMVLLKGDLNYRKLVNEIRCCPFTKFNKAAADFTPAPIITARVIKSETITGMKKGKLNKILKKDPEWLTSGNYAAVQYNKKKEKLKAATLPCLDWGISCYGKGCDIHTDYY